MLPDCIVNEYGNILFFLFHLIIYMHYKAAEVKKCKFFGGQFLCIVTMTSVETMTFSKIGRSLN